MAAIIFDELKISDDSEQLIIKGHVNEISYLENVTLDSITVQTSDQVKESLDITKDYIYHATLSGRSFDLALDVTAFNNAISNWNPVANPPAPFNPANPYADTAFSGAISDKLFFVYVSIDPTHVAPDCPCNECKTTTVGTLFDEKKYYDKVLQFTKELRDKCSVPIGFTDFILLWYTYNAAVKTEHWQDAIKYYNYIFDLRSPSNSSKKCGCHD